MTINRSYEDDENKIHAIETNDCRQSEANPGLDPPIGKIGICLGPRALEGPAGPCRDPFKAQFSFVNYWKK